MARPKPRRLPSTSLRYRIFSPSFILQFVMFILRIAMYKGQGLYLACFQWIEPETLDIHRLQRNSKYHLGYGDAVHRATDIPASEPQPAARDRLVDCCPGFDVWAISSRSTPPPAILPCTFRHPRN